MTLRVLHLDTERGWRGGERQVFWLARELARRGHLSVVAARGAEPLIARCRDAGLATVVCDAISELDVRAALALRRFIRSERISIVHAHTGHAVGLAAIATIGTRVPYVAARRVDFPLRRNVGTRMKYGRAAAVIAVSRAVAAVVREGGVADDRIHVVPDGVDVHRRVEPASEEVLGSLGVPSGAPLVVQVAQLVGHKDPLNFVRAIDHARAHLPAIRALLVGDGPLRQAVEGEIAARGLGAELRATGFRTDADNLLAAATVACLSSREEGMGSVLLDAASFGIPVAATRAGGIPEVVVDGSTGLLVPSEDPAQLGDAIVRLLKDPALRGRLAANACARVADFSVERMTDRTVAVYERVLQPG